MNLPKLLSLLILLTLVSFFVYFYAEPVNYNILSLNATREFLANPVRLIDISTKDKTTEPTSTTTAPPPRKTTTTTSTTTRPTTRPAVVQKGLYSQSSSLLPYADDDPRYKIAVKEFLPENDTKTDGGTSGPPLKKILFWNDAYSNKHFGFGFGREPFIRAGCRVNTCTTTGNRDKYPLEEIDALIWHFRSSDRSLPKIRSPHTRYVFWMMESASYLFGNIETYKNVFNWTMTYRLDSDFKNPYGRVFRRQKPVQLDRNYAEGKTKLAAWFVSNCNTIGGRETFVRTLKKMVDVDIYGGCGPLKCERSRQNQCYRNLNETYKFYFSFENSLCQDYTTEKLFNILQWDVIPVVFGLGNYSVQAPPHSYIDALSFQTAKDLAEYLLYLDKNDTAYNEYFEWKNYYYTLPGQWAKVAIPYCEMCERLHTDTSVKTYNLMEWFVKKSHCLSRSSPNIRSLISG